MNLCSLWMFPAWATADRCPGSFYLYLDKALILSHLHMNGIRTGTCFHCVRAFYILSVLLLPFAIHYFACCCVFYLERNPSTLNNKITPQCKIPEGGVIREIIFKKLKESMLSSAFKSVNYSYFFMAFWQTMPILLLNSLVFWNRIEHWVAVKTAVSMQQRASGCMSRGIAFDLFFATKDEGELLSQKHFAQEIRMWP